MGQRTERTEQSTIARAVIASPHQINATLQLTQAYDCLIDPLVLIIPSAQLPPYEVVYTDQPVPIYAYGLCSKTYETEAFLFQWLTALAPIPWSGIWLPFGGQYSFLSMLAASYLKVPGWLGVMEKLEPEYLEGFLWATQHVSRLAVHPAFRKWFQQLTAPLS